MQAANMIARIEGLRIILQTPIENDRENCKN
jgi:hypothetical protein